MTQMYGDSSSQNVFFLDLVDREEDLWSSSSPQPQQVPFQTIHIASDPPSPANPVFEASSSNLDDKDKRTADDHLHPSPSASPTPRQTTAHEWQVAAQENLDGVHYTRERFPSDAISYLATTFAREPVQVEQNERVLILDEVNEFALRVRVLRNGAVGVIPAWNVEGALERLARLNMMFNEVVRTLTLCPGADY